MYHALDYVLRYLYLVFMNNQHAWTTSFYLNINFMYHYCYNTSQNTVKATKRRNKDYIIWSHIALLINLVARNRIPIDVIGIFVSPSMVKIWEYQEKKIDNSIPRRIIISRKKHLIDDDEKVYGQDDVVSDFWFFIWCFQIIISHTMKPLHFFHL